MSNDLVVSSNQTAIQQGGLGVDFSSKLFQLKPATLAIVQNNSTVGTGKGNLRISETGDEFTEMFVTLLTMPTENRAFYGENDGSLNRVPENLLCFSRDMVKPDASSKVPQALTCAACSHASWAAWRKEKESGVSGPALKKFIPACDPYYYVTLIDTVYRLPLQMWVRSKSREPFERGMQNIARTLATMQAQGKNPNLFDVRFRLSTKQITSGQFKSYVLDISDVKRVSDEERETFGEIYLQYVQSKTLAKAAAQEEQEQLQAQDEVDAALSDTLPPADADRLNERGEIII